MGAFGGRLGRGVGHGLELDSPFASVYVKFIVTIFEVAYKSGRPFEENIRHSIVTALGIAYTHCSSNCSGISSDTAVCIMTYLLTFPVV